MNVHRHQNLTSGSTTPHFFSTGLTSQNALHTPLLVANNTFRSRLSTGYEITRHVTRRHYKRTCLTRGDGFTKLLAGKF